MITTLPRTLTAPETIHVHRLDTDPQIRMRNGFDDESIKELAASITRHGLLQPILVRPTGLDRFTVIAGHRRLHAVRLLDLPDILAIVVDECDSEAAFEAQLAENIQRERLTLADTADAVRTLARIYDTPAEIAKVVGKSKSWVSKHLSLTKDSFPPLVTSLLADDITEDLDLLLALAQIAKLDKDVFADAVSKVRAGKLGRNQVRDILEKLKAPKIDDAAFNAQEPTEEDAAPTGRILEVSFSLNETQAALFESLGGASWVRAQLRAAAR